MVTPLGEPVLPEVNISAARSRGMLNTGASMGDSFLTAAQKSSTFGLAAAASPGFRFEHNTPANDAHSGKTAANSWRRCSSVTSSRARLFCKTYFSLSALVCGLMTTKAAPAHTVAHNEITHSNVLSE